MANNDWLDIELLEDYLDGKLDSQMMYKIERESLEDPFVAQALAGLSASPRRARQSVSLLQKQLYERIGQQEEIKRKSVFTWQRLSVAAAAAVMLISVSIIFFMRDRVYREQLAKQPRKVEVNIAPTPEQVDAAKSDNYAAAGNAAQTEKPVSGSHNNPLARIKNETVIANAKPLAETVQATEQLSDTVSAAVASKEMSVRSARIATVAAPVSSPIGGWASFDTYLTDHNSLSKGAQSGIFVELSFLIDTEGNPTDIKVLKTGGTEFDQEAVRLIKEGPKWEQPKSAESRVSYTVAF